MCERGITRRRLRISALSQKQVESSTYIQHNSRQKNQFHFLDRAHRRSRMPLHSFLFEAEGGQHGQPDPLAQMEQKILDRKYGLDTDTLSRLESHYGHLVYY